MDYAFQFGDVFAAWPLLLKGTWLEKAQHGRIIVDGIELTAGGRNIEAVRAEDGMTMLCVTHEMGFALVR